MFVAVPACGHFGLWLFRCVAVSVLASSTCGRYDQDSLHFPICWIFMFGINAQDKTNACVDFEELVDLKTNVVETPCQKRYADQMAK